MAKQLLWVCALGFFVGSLPAQEPLPAGALHRLGTAKFRHGSRILALAYSPNQRLLAAGGGNDPIRLWDADTGAEHLQIKEQWTYALAFSRKGSELISAGAFKKIRIWGALDGKVAATLEGHSAPVKVLAISPGDEFLASGGEDGSLILWEYATRKIVPPVLKGHQQEITALAFAPARTGEPVLLASASLDRTIRLWNVDDSKLLQVLDGGCGVLAVAFSADGKTLYSAGDDQLLRVWDVATGKLLDALSGHKGSIHFLKLIPGTPYLLSAGQDGPLLVWDAIKKQVLHTLPRSPGDSDALALSRDGQHLAAAGANNTVRQFSLQWNGSQSWNEITLAAGHQAPVPGLALSKDGKTLISASSDGRFRMWEPGQVKTVRDWNLPNAGPPRLAWSSDGSWLASVCGPNAKLLDAKTGEVRAPLPISEKDPILSIQFAPDKSLLALGHRSGKVQLFDPVQGKSVREFALEHPIGALGFSVDGNLLAATGGGKVQIWDLAAGKGIHSLQTRDGPPENLPQAGCLAFASSGNQIAIGCFDGVARLLDYTTGKTVRTFDGHHAAILSLAFTSDSRTLVTASFDHTVRSWEAFSGRQIKLFQGHRGPVQALALAPDDRSVYSSGADTSILHWDLTGISPTGALPKLQVDPALKDKTWRDLAVIDPAKGQDTLWKLIASQNSVPFLLDQAFLVEPAYVDQLFVDLDSKKFAVRQKATEELARLGRWLEDRYRKLLADKPSQEVKTRLDLLLHRLEQPDSLTLEQEKLRALRTLLLLEHVATPEAVKVIREFAKKAPHELVRAEAEATLERLRRRGVI